MNKNIENRIIYHYTTLSVANELMKNNAKLYATHGYFLNDTKEFSSIINMVYKTKGNISPELHNLFVLSFSLSGNDLSQWRSYTPNGGLSIGFSSKYLWESFEGNDIGYKNDIRIKKGNDFLIYMGKCKYVEDVSDDSNIDKMFFNEENILDFLCTVLFWKQKEFINENEYRIVFAPTLKNGSRQIEQIGGKPRVVIPFKYGCSVHNSIRKFIVSPHGDNKKIEHNLRILLSSYGYGENITVEQSSIPYKIC